MDRWAAVGSNAYTETRRRATGEAAARVAGVGSGVVLGRGVVDDVEVGERGGGRRGSGRKTEGLAWATVEVDRSLRAGGGTGGEQEGVSYGRRGRGVGQCR